MGRLLAKLKGVDFFRKIPTDLTEATLAGASISVTAAAVIIMLLSAVRGRRRRWGLGAHASLPFSPGLPPWRP
jgi:hypothetical protein